MASTTVEGQRLERGFESSKRVAEIRAIEADLQKQKAEMFIAEEERKGKGPKITENPFFKTAGTSNTSPVNSFPTSGYRPHAAANGSPKVVSNAFVLNKAEDSQSIKNNSTDVPPLPAFGSKPVAKVATEASNESSTYEERSEFSFSSTADENASNTIKKPEAKPTASLAASDFKLPNFADRKQTLPEVPNFKDPNINDLSGDKADGNEFAYAPIENLHKSLRTESEAALPEETSSALKSFTNPINKTSGPNGRHPVAAFAEFEQPAMQTAVSIPQAPVMMQGVVQIAETTVPAVEGRLVAAQQPINDGASVGKVQPRDTIQKQISRTDRLLANVSFFEPDDKPVQSAPRTFAIPGRPVPQTQPQIVINLNAGNAAAPQPAPPANQGIVIQPNFAVKSKSANKVALASSTATLANRATISKADIVSAVRSKYALKGKCPVTLLTEGRWVDGNKQIGCIHRDRVYLFANAESRESFLADPDKLSPLLAGFDPVIFEETGKLIEGVEKFGTFMGKKPNQRIVLFRTADTRDRFQKEPSKYLDVVRRAMDDKAPKEIKLR